MPGVKVVVDRERAFVEGWQEGAGQPARAVAGGDHRQDRADHGKALMGEGRFHQSPIGPLEAADQPVLGMVEALQAR